MSTKYSYSPRSFPFVRSMLSNAHDFIMHQPRFTDKSRTTFKNPGTGIQTLYGASIPGAAHDAAAREYAPRCHPGTRQDYIEKITQWGLGSNQRNHHILWVEGPAGVGKSAVAQSCADALGDKLGAAFFFSRPGERDKPGSFFPSVVYQLAMKHQPYRQILDDKIGKDPALVTKSMAKQFYHLLASPLGVLKETGKEIGEKVIIVDGLDECEGPEAQCSIIKVIAASIQDQTTPFLWIFFSRPESHLVSTFNSPDIEPLSLHLELPVSRDTDDEIRLFLTEELRRVRQEHKLPLSWPSAEAITVLVRLSAGLFIYAATVVRFISDPGALDPEGHLNIMSALAANRRHSFDTQHPLSELDLFYTLIMQRVPRKILDTVKDIILLASLNNDALESAGIVANLLDLTKAQFHAALRSLHSVLLIRIPYNGSLRQAWIHFYHASFLDFLSDPKRSGEFSFNLRKTAVWKKMLVKLETHTPETIPLPWPFGGLSKQNIYRHVALTWAKLSCSINIDSEAIRLLRQFDFKLFITPDTQALLFDIHRFYKNFPRNDRSQIIRRCPSSLLKLIKKVNTELRSCDELYIFGWGNNRIQVRVDSETTHCQFHPHSFLKLLL